MRFWIWIWIGIYIRIRISIWIEREFEREFQFEIDYIFRCAFQGEFLFRFDTEKEFELIFYDV